MATEIQTPSAQNDELLSKAEDMQTTSATPEVVEAEATASLETKDLDTEAQIEDLQTSDEAVTEEVAEEETFAGKSKSDLVELLARLLESEPVQSLRQTAEAIKVAFYKLHRSEVESARKAFAAEGGEAADFVAPTDELEHRLKDLLKEYRRKRDEFVATIESQKEMNLKIKLQIIEELKDLVSSDETLNHTFTKFRELQQRWKETGAVPVQSVKDVWETYNLHTENFYNFIKINKELRDLDLKKNLEQKTLLCEQAEALKDEASVVEAFRKLQKLHDDWREIGPVANEIKEALWTRFKDASSAINKLHQEYFEQLKGEQVGNLERKEALCAEAEELLAKSPASHKEWNKASDRLLEIQKSWKGIGFAPKKDNNRIYDRFRKACDSFFEAKRQFYVSQKGEMEQNMQQKISICERAEALIASEDWKSTTDELIALQAEWKKVGAVSQRQSDQVWKRFRAACDAFFDKKASHFSEQDSEQDANLKAKEALLEEMAAVNIAEVGGFEAIKGYQQRWSAIGFVPIKSKDSLQKRYKEVVDAMFTTLRGSERDRSMNRFKDKISTMKTSGGGDRRMKSERERLMSKVKQLEADIALLENNIGFFSKSKGAEALIADVNNKIEKARREKQEIVEKVKMIDREEA